MFKFTGLCVLRCFMSLGGLMCLNGFGGLGYFSGPNG